jgi:hypothetical protein
MIYKTLEHYLSYAKCDGISMSAIDKQGLLALVYSTFNSIYNLFEIENSTAKKNFLSMIKKLLPKPLKFIFKKFFLIKTT